MTAKSPGGLRAARGRGPRSGGIPDGAVGRSGGGAGAAGPPKLRFLGRPTRGSQE